MAGLVLVAAAACSGSNSDSGSTGQSASSAGSGSAPSGPPVDISVGVIAISDVAPLYLGMKQGFFAQQGLNVKATIGAGGAALIPALTSGSLQFIYSNTVSVLTAVQHGLDLKIVTAGTATPAAGAQAPTVVVAPTSGSVTRARDLAGKTVATGTIASLTTVLVSEAIAQDGGDPSKTTFVEIPDSARLQALASHKVDAAITGSPGTQLALAAGNRQVVSQYDTLPAGSSVGVYVTSQAYIEKNSATVQKFIKAMNQSLVYAQSHPDDAKAVLTTYMQTSAADAAITVFWQWPSTFDPTAALSKEAELAVKYKLLTSVPDLSKLTYKP
jgi:NitT/TauT family transport system substrate-binding protein